jgi:hypothetical protein
MHHPFETRRATIDATRRNAIDRNVIGPPSPRPQIIAARKHPLGSGHGMASVGDCSASFAIKAAAWSRSRRTGQLSLRSLQKQKRPSRGVCGLRCQP